MRTLGQNLATVFGGRARLIAFPPSAFDPKGEQVAVECLLHGERILVEISPMEDFLIAEHKIEKALLRCSGCSYKTEEARTRFPEGAEL